MDERSERKGTGQGLLSYHLGLNREYYMPVRGYEIYLRVFISFSDHFPKIFQNCSEGLTNVSEHFSNTFRR